MNTANNLKVDTRKAIELAIKRIQDGTTQVITKGAKLSIASAAKEASLSNATIHNESPRVSWRLFS